MYKHTACKIWWIYITNFHFIPSCSTKEIKESMSRVSNEGQCHLCLSPGDSMLKGHYGMTQKSNGKNAALKMRLPWKSQKWHFDTAGAKADIQPLAWRTVDFFYPVLTKMHFSLSDALHPQQWLYLSVHTQMAPCRTELHTHWMDFLTSWYCQFIRGKFNNHPQHQRRSENITQLNDELMSRERGFNFSPKLFFQTIPTSISTQEMQTNFERAGSDRH